MLFVLKSLFPTRLFSLTSIAYLIASWIFPTALQASIWFTHQSSQISHWYQYLPRHPNQNTESHFYHPISSHCISHPVSLQVLLTLMKILQLPHSFLSLQPQLPHCSPCFYHFTSALTTAAPFLKLIIPPDFNVIYLKFKSASLPKAFHGSP